MTERILPRPFAWLSDVDLAGLADGDAPVWDNTAKRWKPGRTSTIESVNTVAASGSTQTLPDVDQYTMHDITLTANCAITFPAATPGKSFALRLHGGFTVTWDSQARWHGGTAPILSSGVDTFWFVCFEAGRFECGVGGLGHS